MTEPRIPDRCAAVRSAGVPARWVACGYRAGHRGVHAAPVFGGAITWTTPSADDGR